MLPAPPALHPEQIPPVRIVKSTAATAIKLESQLGAKHSSGAFTARAA
jgi:hypothetical protein